MTNKEKYEQTFGTELPEVLKEGCFRKADVCPMPVTFKCKNCIYNGVTFWYREYTMDAPETATKTEIDALILRGLTNALDNGETLTEEDKGVFKAMCEIKKVMYIFWEMKRRDAKDAED